jgi:hypothetical protein
MCAQYWTDDQGKLNLCVLDSGHTPECQNEDGLSYSETVEMI